MTPARAPTSVAQTSDARRRRGRLPRVNQPTVVISIRVPVDTYDAYCRHALARRESVRTALQRVLVAHAPY